MEISVKEKERIVAIFLKGELDMNNINQLKTLLDKYFDIQTNLYLDFTEVNYIDSLAIGFLIKTYRKYLKYGLGFYLTNLKENLMRIFKLTHIDKYFNIKKHFDFTTIF